MRWLVIPWLIAALVLNTPANPYLPILAGSSAAAYTANTAVFDGTNDLMRLTSSGPTGLADGKVFTCSFWLKMGNDGVEGRIFNFLTSGEVSRFQIARTSGNKIQLFARNSGSTDILNVASTDEVRVASGWVHVYCCIDLTDTAKRKIYLNGISSSLTVTTYTDDTIDWVSADAIYGVGAYPAASPLVLLNGTLSELWFNDSYLDDVTKFASGGCPISLGSDGSLPTGSSPVFYLKGSGNGFNVNSGTGGDFTVTGSLGTTTAPCP